MRMLQNNFSYIRRHVLLNPRVSLKEDPPRRCLTWIMIDLPVCMVEIVQNSSQKPPLSTQDWQELTQNREKCPICLPLSLCGGGLSPGAIFPVSSCFQR